MGQMILQIKLLLLVLKWRMRWLEISHIRLLQVLIIGHRGAILLLEELLRHLIVFLTNGIKFGLDVVEVRLVKGGVVVLGELVAGGQVAD